MPQKLMLNSQSICAWSISLNWPSRATPALLMTMFSEGWALVAAARNLDLAGLGNIEAVRADLALAVAGDLGGDLLQPGLVAIGQRQIAAACGELQRQRAADAARRAGDGGGTSGNSSHSRSTPGR